MHIAIVGAGNVGLALARGWSEAGHRVTMGVRPASQEKAKTALGAQAIAANVADPAAAAAGSDLVALVTPWETAEAAARDLGDLKGKPLIDVTNPFVFRDGGLHLIPMPGSSGGEKISAAAPTAQVFKTMNQVGLEIMYSAKTLPRKPMMFVAGPQGQGKDAVREAVSSLGFEVLDAGPISMSASLEHLALLWVGQAFRPGADRIFAFARVAR
jgi:hypothetical protein